MAYTPLDVSKEIGRYAGKHRPMRCPKNSSIPWEFSGIRPPDPAPPSRPSSPHNHPARLATTHTANELSAINSNAIG